MGFFKDLNEMIGEGTITLSITKAGEKMHVLLIPKIESENAKTNIAPMHMAGTPDELDNAFIDTVKSSLELLKGVSVDIAMFEKTIKAAAEEVKNKATKPTIPGKKKTEDPSQKTLMPESSETQEMNLEDDDEFGDDQNASQKEPEKPVVPDPSKNKKPGSKVKEPKMPGVAASHTDVKPDNAGLEAGNEPGNTIQAGSQPAAGTVPAGEKVTEPAKNEPIIDENEEW